MNTPIDQTLAIAQAVMIAGFVASFAQEAFLSRFEGQTAKILSILTSLMIGLFATARVASSAGFTVIVPNDTLGSALAVVAFAGVALAASQAAFRVIVRPLNTPPSLPAPN